MKRSNVLGWLVGVFVASLVLTLVIDFCGWLLGAVFLGTKNVYWIFPFHSPAFTFGVLFFVLLGFFLSDMLQGQMGRQPLLVWRVIKRMWSYFMAVTFFMLAVGYVVEKISSTTQDHIFFPLATFWWLLAACLFLLDLTIFFRELYGKEDHKGKRLIPVR